MFNINIQSVWGFYAKKYTKMYKFKLNLYKVNGFIGWLFAWLIRIWICGHYLTKQNALIIIIENQENIYNFYIKVCFID